MFTNDRRNPNFIPDLFNVLLGAPEWNEPFRPRRFSHPPMNIIEGDEFYKLELVVPGMQKDDFDVKINNVGELVVSVEKKAATAEAATENNENAEVVENEPKERYLRHDFHFPKFTQTFTLPEDVDLEGITARMADGILTVVLPKKKPVEPQDNTRLIKVM